MEPSVERTYILYRPTWTPPADSEPASNTTCVTKQQPWPYFSEADLLNYSPLVRSLGPISILDQSEAEFFDQTVHNLSPRSAFYQLDANIEISNHISLLLSITRLSDLIEVRHPGASEVSLNTIGTGPQTEPYLEFQLKIKPPGPRVLTRNYSQLPTFNQTRQSKRFFASRGHPILSSFYPRYTLEIIIVEEIARSGEIIPYARAYLDLTDGRTFCTGYSTSDYEREVFAGRNVGTCKTQFQEHLQEEPEVRSPSLLSCQPVVELLDQFYIVASCLMMVLRFLSTSKMESFKRECLRNIAASEWFKTSTTQRPSSGNSPSSSRFKLKDILLDPVSKVRNRRRSAYLRGLDVELTYDIVSQQRLVYLIRKELSFYTEVIVKLLSMENLHTRFERGLLRATQLALISGAMDQFVFFVRNELMTGIGIDDYGEETYTGSLSDEGASSEQRAEYSGRKMLLNRTVSFLRGNLRLIKFLVELRAPSIEERIWRYCCED